MALPGRSWLVLIALPVFTICAATLYYYHTKDKEWKRYLKHIQQEEEEVEIPIDLVGIVIGRGGTNIKLVQDKTGTKINFKDISNNDNVRLCKISGAKENVEEAKKIILNIINQRDIQVLEMWVDESICGKIIGRCGDTVRAITRATNAKVFVDKSKTSFGNRLVIIKGKPEEVAHARQMVDNIIKEALGQKNSLPRSPRARAKNRKGNGIVANKVPQFERLIGSSNESMIQVYVSSVASPSHFWLQLISPRAVELDHLVDDMTDYYAREENQELHKLKDVKKGQIVASKFQHDQKWYRVEIHSIELNESDPGKSKIDVFYVDYGDSAYYNLEDLLELKPEYLKLKFQAIEASMAGIKPKNGQWEEADTEIFMDMVHSAQWKAMLAQVVSHKTKANSTHEGMIPFVRLYDPDGNPGVDIGTLLVEKGYAVHDKTDEPLAENTKDDDDDDDW